MDCYQERLKILNLSIIFLTAKQMYSKFAKTMYNLATNTTQREAALQAFQEVTDNKIISDRTNALLREHYIKTYQQPRQTSEDEYRIYISERDVVFKEFMRTKNVATLQELVSMKPPVATELSTVFTQYANPMLL